MRQLADLVDVVMRDDRVDGVLSTRTHGLLGLPVDFNGGTAIARRVLEGGNEQEKTGEWWSMHDESELAKLLSWGIMMGVGLAQRIELPRVVGRPHRYKLRTWSPRWLQYHHYPADNTSHWTVLTQEGQEPIVAGDGEWILFTPYGDHRPWADGKWRSIVVPWLMKHYALEDRANNSEIMGTPTRVGTTSKGSTEKQRALWMNQLANLGKAGTLVIPEGWKYELVEATGKAFEVFEGQVDWADKAMAVILAGQAVTTEGTSGFSSGNIFDAIKQDFVRFDAERLATCLRVQSLQPWALRNFASAAAAPSPHWQTQRPPNEDEKSKGLSALGDAISKLDSALAPHGYKTDIAKLLVDFGVPVIKVVGNGNQ